MKKSLIALTTLLLTTSAFSQTAGDRSALLKALDDEYKAKATYLQVMEDFGNIRPFSNIVNSEQRHIDALKSFFAKYDMAIPPNHYLGNIPSYATKSDACRAGVEAEIANVDLYDELYSLAQDPELIRVFNRLQWASQEKHLPAFQRCAR